LNIHAHLLLIICAFFTLLNQHHSQSECVMHAGLGVRPYPWWSWQQTWRELLSIIVPL